MRFLKLRIAWTIFWSALAILLIVWWMRSYRVYDTIVIALPGSKCMELGSHFGQFVFYVSERSTELGSHYWVIIHQELDGDEAEGLNVPGWFGYVGFYYFDFWLPFVGLIATAAASWLVICLAYAT